MFSDHLRPRTTTWKHDRSLTVGASEIGACARQVWFRKNGITEEREPSWGFGERGHVIEDWVFKALARAGIRFRNRQKTLTNGYLSATLDGVRHPVCVDVKSFDPRKSRIVEPKHILQVQVQLGLWNETYKRKLTHGVLLYINASDYSDAREHVVEPDPAAYAVAKIRAAHIMTTREPPPREGHIAGGDECRLCLFQTACLGKPIEDRGHLSETGTAAVSDARDEIIALKAETDAVEAKTAAAKERIRDILRAADTRRAPGLARINRSQRTTLDTEALERAGIDLAPYRKPGRETETVSIE